MHTVDRLKSDLLRLGVLPGGALMVHASLSSMGRVAGGAETVVRALLAALGENGTLVMPAFRESLSVAGLVDDVPAAVMARAGKVTPPHDPATTATTMGAIAETFRCWPDVVRSAHPTSSVIAHGPRADQIVSGHPVAWATGTESPFARLHDLDAQLLLLGVGFNRLTMLHYAETLLPRGRRKTRLVPVAGEIVPVSDTGDDNDTHFPAIGAALACRGLTAEGMIGDAPSVLVSARSTVAVARDYLSEVLAAETAEIF